MTQELVLSKKIVHTRIKSGYDIELNFGASFFLVLVQAAYHAGKIPARITFGGITLEMGAPTRATILPGAGDGEIEFGIPLSGPQVDAEIGIRLRIEVMSNDKFVVRYNGLDEETQQLIEFIGNLLGRPDLLRQVNERLSSLVRLEEEIPNIRPASIKTIRRVEADAGYEAAVGIYANFEWSGSAGNASNAVSILPQGRSFAAGMSNQAVERVEKGYKFDPDYRVREQQIKLGNGVVEITLRGKRSIPILPDASWKAFIRLTPKTTAAGRLVLESKVDLDVDAGILTDLLAGAVGLLLGGFIGAVAGVTVVEVGESVAASTAKKGLKSLTNGLFNHMPTTFKLDPADDKIASIVIRNRFNHVLVNTEGLTVAGSSDVTVTSTETVCQQLKENVTRLQKLLQNLEDMGPASPEEIYTHIRAMASLRRQIDEIRESLRKYNCLHDA